MPLDRFLCSRAPLAAGRLYAIDAAGDFSAIARASEGSRFSGRRIDARAEVSRGVMMLILSGRDYHHHYDDDAMNF